MRLSLLSIALSAALCAACSADVSPPQTPAPTVDPAAPQAPPITSPDASLAEPDAASDAQHLSNPDGEDDQARFSGYGEVKFGIAAADMDAAWGGELNEMGKGENASCYFMTPAWVKNSAEFNFMIVDGKFVRYGTESTKFVAPGGGKVGMTTAEIQSLYPDRIEVQPHKYSDGKYLRIKDAATGTALLFETDTAGKVTEWRVGMPPQVDYVEGCS